MERVPAHVSGNLLLLLPTSSTPHDEVVAHEITHSEVDRNLLHFVVTAINSCLYWTGWRQAAVVRSFTVSHYS